MVRLSRSQYFSRRREYVRCILERHITPMSENTEETEARCKIIQSSLLLGGAWATWRIIQVFLLDDPLSVVDGPPPDSLLTGSFLQIFDNNGWAYFKKITDKYGSVFRFGGFFNTSNLFVYDPKALHHIVLKDQNIYEEPEDFILNTGLIFGKGLFATLGDPHRKQRKLLNPVFSIAHMREMTPVFYNIVGKLRDTLKQKVAHEEKEIDMLRWMARTALELIGQSGYGYSFDTLKEDSQEHPFATSIKDFGRANGDVPLTLTRLVLLPYVINIGPAWFRRIMLNLLPWEVVQELKQMSDVMHQTSVEIFEATKRSLLEGGSKDRIGGGKDIMTTLLKANMDASAEDKLPESELLAQISTITFAAMDTTSNALSRILHLLSQHQEVQERLRQEILDARKEHGSDAFTYDTLVNLPLLDAICRETLRLHAPVPFLSRHPTKDMILPLSKPITRKDGMTVNEIFVPRGTRVVMGLLHCNRNPDIWGPDAEEWKPERWLSPLPSTVIDAPIPGIYSHLMTFLGGGRACIGFKFSQLEMKVVLSVLIPEFRFSLTEKKIEWQMNGIVQPTTEKAERTDTGHKALQLPLNVRLA